MKPPTWTQSATTSHRDMLNLKRMAGGPAATGGARSGAASAGASTRGTAETMSFVDFVRSIPLFHSLQVQGLLMCIQA